MSRMNPGMGMGAGYLPPEAERQQSDIPSTDGVAALPRKARASAREKARFFYAQY
ncbi:hypothetical protein LCGC14_3030330, partial [marine sediment metagenome]